MKKEIALIGLLILISIVISGCSGMFSSKTGITPPDFRTGTQGIALRWIENAPPATMYEDSPLTVSFEMWNKGAYDLSQGRYTLSYDPNYISLTSSDVDKDIPPLFGKSLDYQTGEKIIVTIFGKTKPLPSQLERVTIPLVLNACYDYSTFITPTVCIDSDFANEIPANKKACAVKTLSSSGQGAPVSVTSIAPKMYAGPGNTVRPEFTITIRNAGNGIIVSAGGAAYDACGTGEIPQEGFNVADLKVTLSDSQLRCRPDKLEFVNSQATVLCSLDSGIDKRQGAYSAPLQIEMSYGYASSATKQFEIKKVVLR